MTTTDARKRAAEKVLSIDDLRAALSGRLCADQWGVVPELLRAGWVAPETHAAAVADADHLQDVVDRENARAIEAEHALRKANVDRDRAAAEATP